jgi:hypothetical protein
VIDVIVKTDAISGLTGLEDGLFPHILESVLSDPGHFEEERKLFYAGVGSENSQREKSGILGWQP